jgi:hypothetical protein
MQLLIYAHFLMGHGSFFGANKLLVFGCSVAFGGFYLTLTAPSAVLLC